MKKLFLFVFIGLLFIMSCRKDINEVNETTITEDPTEIIFNPIINNVNATLVGQVIDKNNLPIVDAQIILNGEMFLTDEFGLFVIKDKTMNTRGALVQVKKEGYFEGSRRFFPKADSDHSIKIQLLEKNFNQEFSAAEGAEIIIDGVAKIEFAPNSIQNSSGNSYSGSVLVASHWLSPTAPETLHQMPGNLQGVTQASEEVVLQTYGMLAVELTSPDGDKLNIATDKTATITMPIPDLILSNAPEEIPLWSYNEDFGLWEEESTASLQNNNYVGEVSHFSFWNCDYPYDLIELDAIFLNDNGLPLQNILVTAEINNGNVGSGQTDNNGVISGLFPANEIFTLKVYSECLQIVFTQEFGPFATNTSLGNIVVNLPQGNITSVQGQLVDCQGSPIQNGLVAITMNGISSYNYITGGSFDIALLDCEGTDTFKVTGINLDTYNQSDSQTGMINSINNLGTIEVCGGGVVENSLQVVIDGNSFLLFTNGMVDNTSNPDTTTLIFPGIDDGASISFGGITEGDYSDNNQFIYISNIDIGVYLSPLPNQTGFSNFEVTQYDDKVVGTFSGEALNNGNIVQVSGSFDINL